MSTREELVLEALRAADGPVSAAVLARLSRTPVRTVKATLKGLEHEGLARRNAVGAWSPCAG
ncbi:hypothetical protein ACIQAC_37530 [Streptomyces sp. NPDC088387]|uniref:hypothetical protein n=1 Tax=Streptomyces sp. NPDC088387 TaxID=3365859 RepID=UPI0037FC1002